MRDLVVWLSSNFDLMVTRDECCRVEVAKKLIAAGGWVNEEVVPSS